MFLGELHPDGILLHSLQNEMLIWSTRIFNRMRQDIFILQAGRDAAIIHTSEFGSETKQIIIAYAAL